MGASILNVDLYNCTGDTLGNISGCTGSTMVNYYPMVGYANIPKRDFPIYVTVPTGTHFIKVKASNINDGGCDLNQIIPVKLQMPATPTPTPTPSPTPTNTPTPLPATATPTSTPSPAPATYTPTPTNTSTPTATPTNTPTLGPPTATPTETPLPVYYSLRNCVQDTGTTYYSQSLVFGTITGLTGSPPYPRAYGVFPNEPFNADHGYWKVEWYTYTPPDEAHSVYLSQYNIDLFGCPSPPTPTPTPIPVGYGVYTGATFGSSSAACANTNYPSITLYVPFGDTISDGDILYTDPGVSTAFVGNSQYYRIRKGGDVWAAIISGLGIVSNLTVCT